MLRRYIGIMIAKGKSRRLIEALLLSALAGGIAYGVTVWLAPDGDPALWVALIVAAITAFGLLAPRQVLNALSRERDPRHKQSESYYDLDYSLKKNSSWED